MDTESDEVLKHKRWFGDITEIIYGYRAFMPIPDLIQNIKLIVAERDEYRNKLVALSEDAPPDRGERWTAALF